MPAKPKVLPEVSAEPAVRYHAPIREWNVSDRPRERLLDRGPAGLTDAELIALIFGNGTHTKAGPLSAVELGKALLQTYGSLAALSRRDVRELTRVTGIGPAKAVQLIAAFEIGRRIEAHAGEERIQVCSPQDVAAVYAPAMRDLKKEIFRVVMLNTANVILGDFIASEGGLSSSIVEPRAIFGRAMLENAAAIICLHNHPSANPEPSREDIRVTKQLVEAGRLMGIPVHDHLIIAGKSYTSLAERGLLG